jgi:hypothetical protein
MCWLITIGVPAQGVVHVRDYHSTRGGIAVTEHSNPPVGILFPPGDHLFDLTRGGCSCGIGLPEPRAPSRNRDRLLRRYRREGWSEAKIARALDASTRATDPSKHHASSTEPLRAVRDLVKLLVRQVGDVRFFAYDEAVATPFKNENSSISISAFNGVERFPPHVLFDIRR